MKYFIDTREVFAAWTNTSFMVTFLTIKWTVITPLRCSLLGLNRDPLTKDKTSLYYYQYKIIMNHIEQILISTFDQFQNFRAIYKMLYPVHKHSWFCGRFFAQYFQAASRIGAVHFWPVLEIHMFSMSVYSCRVFNVSSFNNKNIIISNMHHWYHT